ncbi:hypothetical protein P8860_19280 [Bacillus spizizenii]|uniref:Exodeoxyribonuclease VII large subunit n=1 Tax=Bacillus spizizenii TaxID=96241 RepID=A0A9Q4HG39_BACSC|nr:exodeoxyribonuclease VII large subunit [Bacillus spizizenii]MEC0631433.1 hypothetical protein [Bacillus spizizenii]
MSITKLEQKLLERKAEEFNKEVDKGVEIIISAIQKLYDEGSKTSPTRKMVGFKDNHVSDIQQYLKQKLDVRTVYLAGELTTVKNASRGHITELPAIFAEALLEQATTEFFAKLKDVEDVLDGI